MTRRPNRTACDDGSQNAKEVNMLWTLAVILLLMWMLGMITSYTLGGFIHILLVVALIVVLVRLIQGRRLMP